MGSSQSTNTTPRLPARLASRGVPPVLQVKLKKSWMHITALLNEPGAPPAYCLTMPLAWDGPITLRDGTLEAGPPIAHSDSKGKSGSENLISLPLAARGDARKGGEIMRYKWGRKERYCFAIDVGAWPGQRVEKFEWRRSKGADVKRIGQGSYGWKLVRLTPGNGSHRNGGAAFTSDGKEVVAVWANASLRKMSFTNVGELRFCGSGATGELGVRWGLMAIMTCLSVWQREMAAANAGAA